MDKINCVILAGGEGARMFPFNTIMEKSLLPIDGKPCVRHIVDNLRKCNSIGKITICCLNKFLKQFEYEFRDITDIEFLSLPQPCGTAKTLAIALENSEDFVMVHYADCITDINYDHFIERLQYKADSTKGIIAVVNSVKHDYSDVRLAEEAEDIAKKEICLTKVNSFIEKPLLSSYTWTGIALVHQRDFRYYWYKVGGDVLQYDGKDIATHIFPRMIQEDVLEAYTYDGVWADIGNLNSYRKVCKLFEEGKSLSEL